MADLFESLLPEATWAKGKPGMGEIVSEGARKLYEHLIRPAASPGGMAMGAAFGAAPRALAAVGGAALGGLGIAQGVKAAEEGESGLDVAIPAAMGLAGVIGLAAMKGRIAKGLIKGKAGAISEEMLTLAEQLELPFPEKEFSHGEKGGGRLQLKQQKPATPMTGVPDPYQMEMLPGHKPLFRSRFFQTLDGMGGDDGIVSGPEVRSWLKSASEWVQEKKKGSPPEEEVLGNIHKKGLKEELDTFGIRAAVDQYISAHPGRENFSTQELKAVTVFESLLQDQVLQDLVMPREAPVPKIMGQGLHERVTNRRWFQSNLAHHLSAPMPEEQFGFDLIVTVNPDVAEKLGWTRWREGHRGYSSTLTGKEIVNPVVRLRLSPYVDTENRRVLMIHEIQQPFEHGDMGELAALRPQYVKDHWMDIGVRRVIRHAVENDFDLVAWPSNEMLYSLHSPDFPMLVNPSGASRKGIRWRKLSSGNYMVNSSWFGREVGTQAYDKEYSKQELAQAFPKNAADRILKESESANEGMIEDLQFPLRPIDWIRTTYGSKLGKSFREALRGFGRSLIPGKDYDLECYIDFPDDKGRLASGDYEKGELGHIGGSDWMTDPFMNPMHAPKDRVMDIRRWFPEVQLGVQRVNAVRVKPMMHRAATKSNYLTALVPPAVGLGLAAASGSEEQKRKAH